jgi:hypothetical protein
MFGYTPRMAETKAERLFMRGVPVAVGLCLLFLGSLGAWSAHAIRTRGVRGEATVLGLRADQRYRTANYRRHEEFFWVRMEHIDPSGRRREFELQASPSEAEAIHPGSRQKVVYVPGGANTPGGTAYVFDDGRPWVWGAILAVFGLPLGLILIGYGVWGKVPAYPG